MRKKVFFIFIFLFIFLFTSSCDNYNDNYNGISNVVNNYEIENVFLNAKEEYIFNIENQFASSGIDITKYELSSSDEEIVSIQKNIIVGIKTGNVSISGILYERATQTRYIVKVADVYVINTEDMIEVRTAEDIVNMNNNKTGHYILKSDIDLADYGLWQPIGNSPRGNQFSGVFVNPDGYKIKNLTVSSSKDFLYNGTPGFCSVGLFGSIANAYIEGIILENVYIDISDFESDYTRASAGGIASSMLSSIIRNCHVEGTIIAQYYCGGIVGANNWGYILDCSFEGTVKTINESEWGRSSDVGTGGIAGFSATDENSGLIENCKVNGSIVGHYYAGGIIGTNFYDNDILNCTFEGTVMGEKYYNELIGRIKHR